MLFGVVLVSLFGSSVAQNVLVTYGIIDPVYAGFSIPLVGAFIVSVLVVLVFRKQVKESL